MKKNWVLLLIIIGLVGCLEDPTEDVVEQPKVEVDPDAEFIVDVPEDFTWSAVKDLAINVSFTKNREATDCVNNTLVELYEGEQLLDALTVLDGKAAFDVRVASAVEELQLKVIASGETKSIDAVSGDVTFNITKLLALNRNDSDGDGLIDAFDAAPMDANIAINVVRNSNNLKSTSGKSSTSSSYVIFEDLWPSKGDYDFNDLVVKSTYSWTRGKSNYIETVVINCDVEWIGAGLDLGLGYELFEKKGTNLYYLDKIIESIQGGSADNSVDNSVIAFNSIKSENGTSFQIEVQLKEKEIKDFLFIPYLFRTTKAAHQVRPFGAPPTKGQDMNMFGAYNDASPKEWDWSAGTKFKYPLTDEDAFYRTTDNHPWGIEFISKNKFKPCLERTSILSGYPDFREWAESGGKKGKEWYDKPSS